jgi:hypothetical protein
MNGYLSLHICLLGTRVAQQQLMDPVLYQLGSCPHLAGPGTVSTLWEQRLAQESHIYAKQEAERFHIARKRKRRSAVLDRLALDASVRTGHKTDEASLWMCQSTTHT